MFLRRRYAALFSMHTARRQRRAFAKSRMPAIRHEKNASTFRDSHPAASVLNLNSGLLKICSHRSNKEASRPQWAGSLGLPEGFLEKNLQSELSVVRFAG